jgi:hypothetical protein
MRTKFSGIIALLMLLAIPLVISACGENTAATSADKCAFIVGDGEEGRDANIHKTVYPYQEIQTGENSHEKVRYFPCNSRNYIINSGHVYNANGEKVGDRFNLAIGYTKEHTEVKVGVTAFWTLNQTKSVLEKEFAPLCFKYTCYSESAASGNADFSTKGWNGMLGENFGNSIDKSVLQATANTSDEIWSSHNPALYEQLAKELSSKFAENVRQTTGYSNDLFCGSGNSGWKNPGKPGEGTFTCTSVRFVVNSVENANKEQQEQSQKANAIEQQEKVNADTLEIAKRKYGNQAEYWLGAQNTMEHCPQGSTCVIGAQTIPVK